MDAGLDAAWVDRLDASLRSTDLAGGPVCIAHRVDQSGSVFDYHVRVDADGARAAVGPADAPTVTFHMPGEVAAAIRSGTLAPSDAVLLGRVKVAGDIAALISHRDLLAQLDAAVVALQ